MKDAENATNESEEHERNDDLRQWLQGEIQDIKRAAELRVRDAEMLVQQAQNNSWSEEEIGRAVNKYVDRWGDALPGVARSEGMTDAQIFESIDQAAASDVSSRYLSLTRRAQTTRNR